MPRRTCSWRPPAPRWRSSAATAKSSTAWESRSSRSLPDHGPAGCRRRRPLEIENHPLETFDARTRFALWWVRLYGRQVAAKSELRWQALAADLTSEVRDLVPDADKGVPPRSCQGLQGADVISLSRASSTSRSRWPGMARRTRRRGRGPRRTSARRRRLVPVGRARFPRRPAPRRRPRRDRLHGPLRNARNVGAPRRALSMPAASATRTRKTRKRS